MISEKQLAANRRNAQCSTGPQSIEGKAKSSRNNLRHGLTGQISLLPTEDREAHDKLCNELIESFQPATPMERQLAQSIAEDNWRLNRIRAIEDNMFALGHGSERAELKIALADAQTFQEQAAKFNLLTIYEQRINRNIHRNLAQLRELQAERKAQQAQAMEEATLLAQANLVNGLPYEPHRDGFEFSPAEINRAIDRDNRLQAAKALKTSNPKPQTTAARAA
jgi:hypothetical protein